MSEPDGRLVALEERRDRIAADLKEAENAIEDHLDWVAESIARAYETEYGVEAEE